MRVLMIHNYYRYSGGEGNVIAADSAMLTAAGHTVLLYRRTYEELAAMRGLRKLLLPFTALFSCRTFRDVRRLIRENAIDVVHVHNTVPLVSPSVYYAAWSLGVPVVQSIHNFRLLCPNGLLYRDGHICKECLEHGVFRAARHGCYRGSRAQSLLLSAVIALHRLAGTYRRIQAYICLTEYNRRMHERFLPAGRVYVKPNCVAPGGAVTPYASREDAFCCVTRLDAEKGVWVLLDAFGMLPERKLLLAGGGGLLPEVRKRVMEQGMTNVTVLGELANEEARAMIARCRAMVLPTQMIEGFPTTILEAYAAGTPVIGAGAGNTGEAIRASGAGVCFQQDDPAALAAAIRGLTDEALLTMHRKACAAYAAQPSPAENCASLERIYGAALACIGKKGGA